MKIAMEDKEETEFQMAPMIDMVFLLLVFFMCASQLSSQQNIKLEIPEGTKAVVPKERPDRWTINIDVDGNLYEGSTFFGDDLAAVEAGVKTQLQLNPKLKLYLRADRKSPSKNVKRVVQAMAQVGIQDFIFGVFVPSASKQGAAATVTTTTTTP